MLCKVLLSQICHGHRVTLGGKFCHVALAMHGILSDKIAQSRLTVNFGVLELPRWHTMIKQQVNLAESAIFRLRQSEPAPDVAQKVRASVEQCSLRSPIPGYTEYQRQHMLK